MDFLAQNDFMRTFYTQGKKSGILGDSWNFHQLEEQSLPAILIRASGHGERFLLVTYIVNSAQPSGIGTGPWGQCQGISNNATGEKKMKHLSILISVTTDMIVINEELVSSRPSGHVTSWGLV